MEKIKIMKLGIYPVGIVKPFFRVKSANKDF
jgi:hypothetical protein